MSVSTMSVIEHPMADIRIGPAISIVAPTFNEKANIRPFVAGVARALGNIEWELIIVDDDSPDGTYDEVLKVNAVNPRVRCVRRVGRRGLSSAVIEGILSSSAPVIAVMDADMQHDETILPKMLEKINDGADLVVGTRYGQGGGIGTWADDRARMSMAATRISKILVGDATTDPMSGFFMVRRSVVNNGIYDLSQQGYKILLDLISSSDKLTIAEVPYTFRERTEGESKLSLLVLAEFIALVIDKLTKGFIPPRFIIFAGVGGLGVVVHLLALNIFGAYGVGFIGSQTAATMIAMVFNFTVNNEFTFRDRRLTGASWLVGLVLFMATCSIGAIANVSVANLAVDEIGSWNIAGLLGALMGAVFNFGVASKFVWNRRKRGAQAASV